MAQWVERILPIALTVALAGYGPADAAERRPVRAVQAVPAGSVEAALAAHPARMTALFAALDLTRPVLAAVKSALDAGDRATAARALIGHYRSAPTAPWVRANLFVHGPDDVPDPADTDAAARRALADDFTFQGVAGVVPRMPNGGLDWTYRGPRDDREWSLFLNRHFHFLPLVQAYATRRDPALPRYVAASIVDWVTTRPIDENPVERDISSAWQPMSSASRLLQSWPHVYFGFLDSPDFTDEARLLMLSSIPEQAAHLMKHHRKRHNHTIKEMSGLVHAAAAWPEFGAASRWRSYGVETLQGELDRQFYPDGVHQELSAHYHRSALQYYVWVKDFSDAAGTPLPSAFNAAIERGADYLAASLSPTGFGPLNNNGDLDSNQGRVLDLARRFGRDDWRFIATRGSEGAPPQYLSGFRPWAGQAFLRDGFGPDALFAMVDVGPWGAAHQHNDKLNIVLTAHGRDLLVDGGRYRYEEADPFVVHLRGSGGHNVLLLDNLGQGPDARLAERPLADAFVSVPQLDMVHGTYAAPWPGLIGTATHQRAVVHLRGRHIVVIDRIRTDRPRTVTAHWRHGSTLTVVADGTGTVSTDTGVGNLRITPVGPVRFDREVVRGREGPDPLGWTSPDYNDRKPASVARFTGRIEGDAIFAWVLTPAKGVVPTVRTRLLKAKGGAIGLEIATAGNPAHRLEVDLDTWAAPQANRPGLIWSQRGRKTVKLTKPPTP